MAEEIVREVFRKKEVAKRRRSSAPIIRDKYEAKAIIEDYFKELGINYEQAMDLQTRKQILLQYDFFIDPEGPHGSTIELNFAYERGTYYLESCAGMIVIRKVVRNIAECPLFTLSKNIKMQYTHFKPGPGKFCFYHFGGGGVFGPSPSLKEIRTMLKACKKEFKERSKR